MTLRVRTHTALGASALLAMSTLVVRAQDAAPPSAPAPAAPGEQGTAENNAAQDEITLALNETVTEGLERLAAMQSEEGSFGGVRYPRHVGITALACLAFMADGNLPGRGPCGENVQRGIDFVLANINETGLIAADTSHGPMYGHGFAALFLGEVYGMTAGGGDTRLSQRIHEELVKAVRLIVQTQNEEGGWRYYPVPHDADVSVTICQVMALRSARNAGIEVPKTTIDRAVEYIRQCQHGDGGWRYQLTSGGSAWPRTAAGVASLNYAGIYEDDAIDRGLDYLVENAKPGNGRGNRSHYFYGHYYAVQAMYLAGGASWSEWWPLIRDELIDAQTDDGSWRDNHAGPSYGTAMALIILQMPKRYLPIFQK